MSDYNWDLAAIKRGLHAAWSHDTDKMRISAMWWLVRKIQELEKQNRIFHNNLSKSVQRRLDAQGVGLDDEKGKITSAEQAGSIRDARRSGRRSIYDRSRPDDAERQDEEV